MKITFLSLFLFLGFIVCAQNPGQTDLIKRMDDAAFLMDQGKYQEANEELLYVMNNITALPSDIAYYFGRNSFHLKKYKQSINWLNKYIQLKGTQGRFYELATKYLQLAEDEYLKEMEARTDNIQAELASGEYDCGGLSKMICPVCKGRGVVIKAGPFGWIYETCPYSAGEGYLTCEEYNLFMRGQLEPKIKN